jgi:Protein of unknown function (DUF2939)
VRKAVVTLVLIGLIWIGYLAWPLYDLGLLVQAIDARDVSSVLRHVNFDRVRVSLAEQVAAASMRRSGIKSIPLSRQAIVAGLTIADPVINKLVSPEALSECLAVGWPVAIAGKPPPGTIGINRETLGTAWQIFGASHYGLGRFEVSAPIELPFETAFGLDSTCWRGAGNWLVSFFQNIFRIWWQTKS